MAGEVSILDLRGLDLAPGAVERRRLRVPPVELRLGGQDYVTEPAAPEVDLEVGRSLSGLHLRLQTAVDRTGPCVRCLSPARVPIVVDAREFAAEGREGDEFDEDLDSAYVADARLDVALWARDSIAEAVPATILCREDCAGLCPTCGTPRADGCDCRAEATDPRWSGLQEIAERLRREGEL